MNAYLRQIIARCPAPPWLRQAGKLGLLFFLIKGLMWLVVPWLLLVIAGQPAPW